jgi:alcohol dehydrogenase class IV
MMRQVHFGFGSIQRLERILDALAARHVFLVAGRSSFEDCGAGDALRPALRDRRVTSFRDFQLNPQLRDVERGVLGLRDQGGDVVLGVGGGSALDMAKLIALLGRGRQSAWELLREGPQDPRRTPLVLIPTTAGSGSEATHFAVVYHQQQKYSVAHPSLLPDCALVDPALTISCPPRLTAVTGLDALCHAIESFWSVAATDQSREFARQALSLLRRHLVPCVYAPDHDTRRAVAEASHLAGNAINVAKTNLAHALSYAMTSGFGVPHGHAAALTLGDVLVFNSGVEENDCVDGRGAGYVRAAIAGLVRAMGCRDAVEARESLRHLLRDLGLATSLTDLGINAESHRLRLATSVNQQRLANNPRAASPLQIREIVDRAA